ncbi:MAG: hypothetical protein IIT39_16320, partial [Clostridia bacterium]|nr:hypothetical protein [Clostridia bacterium]
PDTLINQHIASILDPSDFFEVLEGKQIFAKSEYLKEYEKGRKYGYTPVILSCDDSLAEILEINSGDIEEYRNKLLQNILTDTVHTGQITDTVIS